MTRFRAGLIIGGAIGYVLGARAGRQRYEQIKQWAATAAQHPAVAQLAEQGEALSWLVRARAANGMETASRALRTAVGS